ncbi:hypothetical protein Fmac_011202 [Flemingia macrophylla]|uniref:DUF6738 domain-containing protein n=1 Tax=Flemingia macrophylla TaxID=520843 RepID=A0ABD1MLR8_9FABA
MDVESSAVGYLFVNEMPTVKDVSDNEMDINHFGSGYISGQAKDLAESSCTRQDEAQSARHKLYASSTDPSSLSLAGSIFIVLCYFLKELCKFSFKLIFLPRTLLRSTFIGTFFEVTTVVAKILFFARGVAKLLRPFTVWALMGQKFCMTRGNPGLLHPFDPEIDRTYHRLVRHFRISSLESIPLDNISLINSEHPPSLSAEFNSVNIAPVSNSDYSDYSDYDYSADSSTENNMAQPPPRERTLRELVAHDLTFESLCIQYPDEDGSLEFMELGKYLWTSRGVSASTDLSRTFLVTTLLGRCRYWAGPAERESGSASIRTSHPGTRIYDPGGDTSARTGCSDRRRLPRCYGTYHPLAGTTLHYTLASRPSAGGDRSSQTAGTMEVAPSEESHRP